MLLTLYSGAIKVTNLHGSRNDDDPMIRSIMPPPHRLSCKTYLLACNTYLLAASPSYLLGLLALLRWFTLLLMGMIRARAGGGMRKQEASSAEDDRDEVQDDLAARQSPSPQPISPKPILNPLLYLN